MSKPKPTAIEALKIIEDCIAELSRIDHYTIETINDGYNWLLKQVFPFEVGDRVKLKNTLKISDDSGWASSRHFLIQGSPATIHSISFNNVHNYLAVHVMFDNETYFDVKGVEQPVSSKHLFSISHKSLIGIDEEIVETVESETTEEIVNPNHITIDLEAVTDGNLKAYIKSLEIK